MRRKLLHKDRSMLTKDISDQGAQPAAPTDCDTPNLKIALIGVLAASACLYILMPQGLITEVSAAKTEYRPEVKSVPQATPRDLSESKWGTPSDGELPRPKNIVSPLLVSQD
jgi:hypothetical protein